PTKEKLADKLAETSHADIASRLFRAKERLRVFAGLRITPVVTVDPETGALGFSFAGSRHVQDVDATLERLLELPGLLAAERGRKVALVLDEFQEIVDIDRHLPKLLRSEHAHFGLVWDKAARAQRLLLQALALEPGRPLASDYRRRHVLPGPSSVQRALGALLQDELVSRDSGGEYRITEPFLAE